MEDTEFRTTFEPVRIAFGARDDDTMPLSWAEGVLVWLRANRESAFRDMMLAILDIEKTGRKGGYGGRTGRWWSRGTIPVSARSAAAGGRGRRRAATMNGGTGSLRPCWTGRRRGSRGGTWSGGM